MLVLENIVWAKNSVCVGKCVFPLQPNLVKYHHHMKLPCLLHLGPDYLTLEICVI